jgi:hypothetical protein
MNGSSKYLFETVSNVYKSSIFLTWKKLEIHNKRVFLIGNCNNGSFQIGSDYLFSINEMLEAI